MNDRERIEVLKQLYKYSLRSSRAGRFISSILIGVKTSPANIEPFSCGSPSVPPIGDDD